MDALARLEPVARPLLRQVDNALSTLGAPAEHPIWGLLRRLGTTPADAVAFFAENEVGRLRATADQLRAHADEYESAPVAARVPWEGAAGDAYAAQASAIGTHLHQGLAGRVRTTSSYVDAIADWYQSSRDSVARALADVLTSTQAVTVRSNPALGHGVAEIMRDGGSTGGGLARAVFAAADIGACLLGAAEDCLVYGRDLPRTWAPDLAELTYTPPTSGDPYRTDATIRLHH